MSKSKQETIGFSQYDYVKAIDMYIRGELTREELDIVAKYLV